MEEEDGLFGCDAAYFSTFGHIRMHHGGHFVGPPLCYIDGQCKVYMEVDADTINVFTLREMVQKLGYPDIAIANLYYKSRRDRLEELTCLDDDDCVRDILEIIKAECFLDMYVDHKVSFPEEVFLLPSGKKDGVNAVGEEGGSGVNVSNVEGNLDNEVNLGKDGSSVISGDGEGIQVNAEKDLSDSETDGDLGSPCNSDKDDEEVIESRRIRKHHKEGKARARDEDEDLAAPATPTPLEDQGAQSQPTQSQAAIWNPMLACGKYCQAQE